MRLVPEGTTARRASVALVVAIATLSTRSARGEPPIPTPFDALGSNIAGVFDATGVVLLSSAVGVTVAMAPTGGDHAARVFSQRHLALAPLGHHAVWVGYVLPTVFAPSLYVIGVASGDRALAGAGAAALQALVLTTLTTASLKWVTGRPFPLHGGAPDAPDRLAHPAYAREFSFWPQTRGRGLSWPSGHTSAAISVAASLSAYYPKYIWIPIASYSMTAGIAAGMLIGDHHWASDIVAGALIGQAVGWSVGRGFRRLVRGEEAASWSVLPSPSGVVVVGSFLSLNRRGPCRLGLVWRARRRCCLGQGPCCLRSPCPCSPACRGAWSCCVLRPCP